MIINLQTEQQTIYQLGTGPHGGGYDDINFNNGMVYLSASAPSINPNTAPAIVSLNLAGGNVLLTGILNGNASATNVITGQTETLNLQDPDSMIVDPLGELVMTSQGDGELITVQKPGLNCQNVFVVPLTSQAGGSTIGNTQLNDTVFTNESAGELLVADKDLNAIYAITAPYFAAAAYSAVSVFTTPSAPSPIESFVGQTNLTTGFVTPIVIGMSNPGGMAFIPSGVNLPNFISASARSPYLVRAMGELFRRLLALPAAGATPETKKDLRSWGTNSHQLPGRKRVRRSPQILEVVSGSRSSLSPLRSIRELLPFTAVYAYSWWFE